MIGRPSHPLLASASTDFQLSITCLNIITHNENHGDPKEEHIKQLAQRTAQTIQWLLDYQDYRLVYIWLSGSGNLPSGGNYRITPEEKKMGLLYCQVINTHTKWPIAGRISLGGNSVIGKRMERCKIKSGGECVRLNLQSSFCFLSFFLGQIFQTKGIGISHKYVSQWGRKTNVVDERLP